MHRYNAQNQWANSQTAISNTSPSKIDFAAVAVSKKLLVNSNFATKKKKQNEW